jgi:hypothetical protein
MWKPAWKLIGIRYVRTDALKPGWNYFLPIFETLGGSLKDENNFLKKN